MTYGFAGTKCKIPGCSNLVWPSKKRGYCGLHDRRQKTGRMNEDGSLGLVDKKCLCCKTPFKTKGRGHRTYCSDKCQHESWRLRLNPSKIVTLDRYTKSDWIIKNGVIRYKLSMEEEDILEASMESLSKKMKSLTCVCKVIRLQRQGLTLRKIGSVLGVSYQRVSQMLKYNRRKTYVRS
jgi:hypothetical protein